jgi:hypothetical protein
LESLAALSFKVNKQKFSVIVVSPGRTGCTVCGVDALP